MESSAAAPSATTSALKDPSVPNSRLQSGTSSRVISREPSFDDGARTAVQTAAPSRSPSPSPSPSDAPVPRHVAQATMVDEPPVLPQASITFILAPGGRRRTMAFDADTTIGRVKELVWNSWPNDWQDERPPMPGYLRVLHLGRMLQDDDTLATLGVQATHPTISAAPPPTVMHLSVRPTAAGPLVAEHRKRGRRGTDLSADGEVRAGGCCGCIIC